MSTEPTPTEPIEEPVDYFALIEREDFAANSYAHADRGWFGDDDDPVYPGKNGPAGADGDEDHATRDGWRPPAL